MLNDYRNLLQCVLFRRKFKLKVNIRKVTEQIYRKFIIKNKTKQNNINHIMASLKRVKSEEEVERQKANYEKEQIANYNKTEEKIATLINSHWEAKECSMNIPRQHQVQLRQTLRNLGYAVTREGGKFRIKWEIPPNNSENQNNSDKNIIVSSSQEGTKWGDEADQSNDQH